MSIQSCVSTVDPYQRDEVDKCEADLSPTHGPAQLVKASLEVMGWKLEHTEPTLHQKNHVT